MKVMSSPLSITKKPDQYASWSPNGMQLRKRKGLHYTADFYNSAISIGLDRYTDRVLSDSDLWTVYRRCADVRACIDSIVRRVATFDWMVVPKVSPQNEDHPRLAEISRDITAFLRKPNKNGDTWQEVMTAMLTDCLCFDAGVLELAYDRKGNLQELVPLRGSTIQPVIDELGRLKCYEQNIFEEADTYSIPNASGASIPKFKRKQIMYLSLFKNTAMAQGNPIIESLVNQVIALMRATEHSMLALDADEIPPGILVLAGIAGRAADEAKADLQRLKGQDHKIRVMTTPDPTGVGAKWLELRRSPKEITMRELVDDIRKTVYRTFGVMPIEMGMSEGMPRATATVQMDVSSSHLVTPILELLAGKINAQIIPALTRSTEIAEALEFRFDRESRLTPAEQQSLSSTYATYIKQGVMTRNEVREALGFLPLIGGDVPTIEVAGMPSPLNAIVAQFDNGDIEKGFSPEPDVSDEQLEEAEVKPVEDFTPEELETTDPPRIV